MQRYCSLESKQVCSMASKYSYTKQTMDKEIYGTPILLEFEGKKYYAPQKFEFYLKKLYGDYMKMPSEEHKKKVMSIYQSVEF